MIKPGKEGNWEGLSTMYDVATYGSTLEETEKSLKEAIDVFIGEVEELPENEKRLFLKRRSPLHSRFFIGSEIFNLPF